MRRWGAGIAALMLTLALALAWPMGSLAQTPSDEVRGAAPLRILGLMVGAGAYGDDPFGLGDLSGPANDARLMAEVLIESGARPEHLIVLTGGLGQDDAADRAGILAAMARLRATARRGDTVVIHLSGHGWRQAEAVAGSEPDGMDELFLPVGYGRAGAGAADGLLDDEIGAVVDAIRARGAHVVFIGDFCHAGDAARGRADFTSAWRDSRLDLAQAGSDAGAYIALFAAPAEGRALQGLAPIWAPVAERRPHGLLSLYLATALRDPAIQTWAQAAARVQADLLDHDIRDRAVRLEGPALFEGDLERPLPGRGAHALAGWTVRKPALRLVDGRVGLPGLTLGAGALHGLAEGDRLTLSEGGAGAQGMLAARVARVTAAQAYLVPDEDQPLGDWSDIRTSQGRPYTQEAVWVARRIARAASADIRLWAPDARLIAGLDLETMGLTWVGTADLADLSLSATPGGADIGIDGVVVGSIVGGEPAQVGLALTRAARALRIRTLLARAAETLGPQGLDLQAYLWRPEALRSGACPPFDPDHAGLTEPPPEARAFDEIGLVAPTLPILRECDVVFVRLENTGGATLDVTPLTLSGDGAIWALPWLDGRPAVRFEPGRVRTTAIQIEGDAQAIDEALVVIAVPSDPLGGAPHSFAVLQQPPIDDPAPLAAQERTRGDGPASAWSELLDQARFEPRRSLAAPMGGADAAILRLPWRVEP